VGWKKGAAVDRHVARMMDQRSELTVQENEGKQRERVTFPGTNVVVKTKVSSKQKKTKRMLAKKKESYKTNKFDNIEIPYLLRC